MIKTKQDKGKMIADALNNLPQYLPAAVSSVLMPFVRQLNAALPDGEYLLDGKKIFARVQTYETKPEKDCRIESHREYIDVQIVLSGSEYIDVFSQTDSPEPEYDVKADVQFYDIAGERFVRYSALPDYFALFFPQDAHRPQIQNLTPQRVKKLVIKIARGLFK
ncbi:MAG: YhcH/YjgK/YiaL family protein [Planctomycetaceae bacterium]|nr:YhcH/YjgK/YiaL family protein [Planctomycetaceae bacterium]